MFLVGVVQEFYLNAKALCRKDSMLLILRSLRLCVFAFKYIKSAFETTPRPCSFDD